MLESEAVNDTTQWQRLMRGMNVEIERIPQHGDPEDHTQTVHSRWTTYAS